MSGALLWLATRTNEAYIILVEFHKRLAGAPVSWAASQQPRQSSSATVRGIVRRTLDRSLICSMLKEPVGQNSLERVIYGDNMAAIYRWRMGQEIPLGGRAIFEPDHRFSRKLWMVWLRMVFGSFCIFVAQSL